MRRKFCCVATDIHRGVPKYFSAEETPDLRVVDGIYMSMTLPFIFAPLRYNGTLYVDGALTDNIPRCFPPEETFHMGFTHGISMSSEIKDIQQYFVSVVRMTSRKEEWYRNYPHIQMRSPNNYEELVAKGQDFDLPETVVRELHAAGYAAVLTKMRPCIIPTLERVIALAYALELDAYSSWEDALDAVNAFAGDRCT